MNTKMTAKEIKEEMTHAEFYPIGYTDGRYEIHYAQERGDNEIDYNALGANQEEAQANAIGLCNAANFTYRKGYDPRAIPDVVEALKGIRKLIDDGDLIRDISRDNNVMEYLLQKSRIELTIRKMVDALSKVII